MTDVANSANTLGVNGHGGAPDGVAADGTGTEHIYILQCHVKSFRRCDLTSSQA